MGSCVAQIFTVKPWTGPERTFPHHHHDNDPTFSMTREIVKVTWTPASFRTPSIPHPTSPRSVAFTNSPETSKGLHVLERFISKNGINADHISHVFQTQPICMKLLHLGRSIDDEITVSQTIVNLTIPQETSTLPTPTSRTQSAPRVSKGLALMDVTERTQPIMGRVTTTVQKYCFAAVTALE